MVSERRSRRGRFSHGLDVSEILDRNIVCGDSLKIMEGMANENH